MNPHHYFSVLKKCINFWRLEKFWLLKFLASWIFMFNLNVKFLAIRIILLFKFLARHA
jgi:hypothetical protein